jgi:hypothetical protein
MKPGDKNESTHPSNEPMCVWRIDDGATYWFAAYTLREALGLYWKAIEDSGGDQPTYLSVDELPEAAARLVRITDDDDRTALSAWERAQLAKEPTVLGCSEWP